MTQLEKDFFGNELSEAETLRLRLRNLRISVDALKSQLGNGVDPSEVNRQMREICSENSTMTSFQIAVALLPDEVTRKMFAAALTSYGHGTWKAANEDCLAWIALNYGQTTSVRAWLNEQFQLAMDATAPRKSLFARRPPAIPRS